MGAHRPLRESVAATDAPTRHTGTTRGSDRVGRLALFLALLFAALLALLAVRRFRAPDGFDPTGASDLLPLLLAALGLILSAAVLAARPQRQTTIALTATAVAWSVAFLLALAGVWYLVDADRADDPAIGTRVVDIAGADAYLDAALPAPDQPAGSRLWRIPTGLLVQSVEFSNANDVQVSGFVWQTFPPDLPSEVVRGVLFPEAVVDTSPADPAYTVDLPSGDQLVGWRFHLTLRERFDYDRYPFDRQDVWLRMWPKDAQRRTVPIPDFAAYRNLDPRALAGVGSDFVPAGWIPERTEFTYAARDEGSSLGLPPALAVPAVPELVFNLALKRSFLEPFLDHVLFAVVVAILLFLILCLTARDPASKTRFGISTFGVLGTCSGLLFAVILKDGQIRQGVSTGEIVYIEVLPFLLYAAILLVAANALILDSPIRVRFVDYRNNLLPDLLFWPVMLGTLLLVTIAIFF